MTKPCPDADYTRDAADVLVQGQVTAELFPNLYLMKVERYYKGEGKQYLLFADTARPSHGHPGEQDWVIGLKDRPSGLALDWCGYLYRPGHESIAALGPGVPPRPGVDLGLWAFWVYITLICAVLVLVLGVCRYLFPLRRKPAR